MHVLAYIYHWDATSLWRMKRNERKMWVKEIVDQKKSERDEMEKSANSVKSSVPKLRKR